MACHSIWLLPVAGFVFGLLTLFVPYVIGAANGHIDWFWPFISDGGATPPESCIFGQLLNTTAVLFAICMYLRHVQIVTFYQKTLSREGKLWRVLSLIMLIIGITACFFVSMVAQFQETAVLWVHGVSAILAFGLGVLYLWCQTIYTYVMRPRLHGIWLCHVRTLVGILCLYSFLQMNFAWRIFDPGYSDASSKKNPPQRWTKGEDGWLGHLLVTTGEWGLVVCFFFYLLTYAYELRYCRWHMPKLKFKDEYLYKWKTIIEARQPKVVLRQSYHYDNPAAYNSQVGADPIPTVAECIEAAEAIVPSCSSSSSSEHNQSSTDSSSGGSTGSAVSYSFDAK